MKDKNKREMKRPFAQNKRPKKEDMYKVRIIPAKPKYDINKDSNRIKVNKHDTSNSV